jgi:O-antigen/teichoic acid export membrane protein
MRSGIMKSSFGLLAIFRKPKDSGPQGRAQERLRRVALTSGSTFAAKGAQIAAGLISVPLTLHYLGAERYGLWMMISSASVMLRYADFGMGNGLINAVAHAHGAGDERLVRASTSSAFFMLAGIAAALLVLMAIVYPFVNWPAVFNVKSALARVEAGPALALFALCTLASMPLGMVQRVQFGYQEGYESNLWLAAGSILGLAGAIVAIRFRGGLIWLVLALAAGPLLSTALNYCVYFGWIRPWLRPSFSYFNRSLATNLARAGGTFFGIQMVGTLLAPFDNILIGHLLGPVTVAQYAVLQKLASLAYMVPIVILTPLWPAYSEALSRGDVDWVRATFRRTIMFSALTSGAVAAGLIAFGRQLVVLWVGRAIVVPLSIMVPLAALMVVNTVADAAGILLYSANGARYVLASAAAWGILGAAMKIWSTGRFGVPGLAWAAALACLLFFALPNMVFAKRVMSLVCTRAAAAAPIPETV